LVGRLVGRLVRKLIFDRQFSKIGFRDCYFCRQFFFYFFDGFGGFFCSWFGRLFGGRERFLSCCYHFLGCRRPRSRGSLVFSALLVVVAIFSVVVVGALVVVVGSGVVVVATVVG